MGQCGDIEAPSPIYHFSLLSVFLSLKTRITHNSRQFICSSLTSHSLGPRETESGKRIKISKASCVVNTTHTKQQATYNRPKNRFFFFLIFFLGEEKKRKDQSERFLCVCVCVFFLLCKYFCTRSLHFKRAKREGLGRICPLTLCGYTLSGDVACRREEEGSFVLLRCGSADRSDVADLALP